MNEEWKGLGLAELIDLLEPVPAPEPVSMVPQTVGWIWLAAFVLVSLTIVIRRVHLWRKRTAYRREALAELEALPDDPHLVADLLRRTALTAYRREEVALLHGKEWLAFLDKTYGGSGFSEDPGRQVAYAAYQTQHQTSSLKPVVRDWIKTHRETAR